MSLTVTIPTLETERLVLRPAKLSDAKAFMAFLMSERAEFVGGPTPKGYAARSFASFSGQWVLRGYGYFIGALKSDPETPLGGFGVHHPVHIEEPEFGWALYDGAYERKGYVTEAMRKIIPWAWDVMGVDTAQSHIDEGNDPSVAVAKALGAEFDPVTTKKANGPGGEFDSPGNFVNIWRHHKGALT